MAPLADTGGMRKLKNSRAFRAARALSPYVRVAHLIAAAVVLIYVGKDGQVAIPLPRGYLVLRDHAHWFAINAGALLYAASARIVHDSFKFPFSFKSATAVSR